jgi:uncharacterized protein YggU (UPF0235/DUF167 family)
VTSLRLHVRPSGRSDRLRGWHADGALRVEVTAVPEDGRANEAVIRLLASALGVRRSAVTVKQGAASRSKRIEVDGLDDAELKQRIQRALDAGEPHGGKEHGGFAQG